jgi:monoamine oxidase
MGANQKRAVKPTLIEASILIDAQPLIGSILAPVVHTAPHGERAIAAQRIRFRPDLPDKVDAASVLPLGLADKLVMSVDKPQMLPVDGHLIGNPNKAATSSYNLCPFGRPLIEAFFGGRLAHELEATGRGAFFDFAVAELTGLLGSDIRAGLRPLVETNWARDPFAQGSYSYALPGHADARATLAAPVDGRLFLRGRPAHGTISRRRMALI